MAERDSDRWDERYRATDRAVPEPHRPPEAFAPFEHQFPVSGTALDVACGLGAGSVWLASRGMSVLGCDVSSVAIAAAGQLASDHGVDHRCEFVVTDLDEGLPNGPQVDLVVCHLFRAQTLYQPMIDRLAANGVIAIAVLSEVGGEPGKFRAVRGELLEAFGHLDVLDDGEVGGRAWIVARRHTDPEANRVQSTAQSAARR